MCKVLVLTCLQYPGADACSIQEQMFASIVQEQMFVGCAKDVWREGGVLDVGLGLFPARVLSVWPKQGSFGLADFSVVLTQQGFFRFGGFFCGRFTHLYSQNILTKINISDVGFSEKP